MKISAVEAINIQGFFDLISVVAHADFGLTIIGATYRPSMAEVNLLV